MWSHKSHSCSQEQNVSPSFWSWEIKLYLGPPLILCHSKLECSEWWLAGLLVMFAVCISRCWDAEHVNCWMLLCLLSSHGRCNWGWFAQHGAVFHYKNFGKGTPEGGNLSSLQIFLTLSPAFSSGGKEPDFLWQGQLQDPSDVQPKKPSITDKYLLVFSFSLQIVSHQSFRMFKDVLLINEILLSCCKLTFLATISTNNPERMRKIIQFKNQPSYVFWSFLLQLNQSLLVVPRH